MSNSLYFKNFFEAEAKQYSLVKLKAKLNQSDIYQWVVRYKLVALRCFRNSTYVQKKQI